MRFGVTREPHLGALARLTLSRETRLLCLNPCARNKRRHTLFTIIFCNIPHFPFLRVSEAELRGLRLREVCLLTKFVTTLRRSGKHRRLRHNLCITYKCIGTIWKFSLLWPSSAALRERPNGWEDPSRVLAAASRSSKKASESGSWNEVPAACD